MDQISEVGRQSNLECLAGRQVEVLKELANIRAEMRSLAGIGGHPPSVPSSHPESGRK